MVPSVPTDSLVQALEIELRRYVLDRSFCYCDDLDIRGLVEGHRHFRAERLWS